MTLRKAEAPLAGTSNRLIKYSTTPPKNHQDLVQTYQHPLENKKMILVSVFRGLLLKYFVHDNIAFRKVDSEHFKAMLTYLEGRLEGNIGSRFSVRRWILDAYVKHTKVIKAKLANAKSLIHLSFDLWTSRSLLSLNGIVVHFVDEDFKARTFLLALPQQKGKHSGTKIADTVRNLLLINIDDWSTKD